VAVVSVPDVPSMLGGVGAGWHALAMAMEVMSAATRAAGTGHASKAGAG
jgi:hypothetical protein